MSTVRQQDPGSALLWAFELDGRGGGRELEWRELDTRHVDGTLRWVHLDFTQPQTREWLIEHTEIDPVIVEALLDDDSRPRSMEHKSGLLTILRGLNTNPGADPEDMVSVRIWLTENLIVTTRRRQLLSMQRLRETVAEGQGPQTSAEFLIKLTQRLGDLIGPAVDKLDEELESAESAFERGEKSGYQGEFASLRRQAARIRRYLAPQRDALDRLARTSTNLLTDAQRLVLREEADLVTRFLEDLDLVRERAMVAQEEILGQLANEQNRRMYVLSLVAAIFLPLSFLTGLMGMNVAGLPGTENTASFNLLVLLMLILGVGIVALFKWRKWM